MTAFLPSSFAAVYCPIRFPALRLSVAKVMSTVSGGIGGSVEGDHVQAGVAGLLDGVVDAGGHRSDQDALLLRRDRVLDRIDLTLVVTFGLTGGDGDVDTGRVVPAFLAPACMATKNGLVESFVINDTAILPPLVPPLVPALVSPLLEG